MRTKGNEQKQENIEYENVRIIYTLWEYMRIYEDIWETIRMYNDRKIDNFIKK